MSKIITQKAEENKHISERIKSFMKKFERFDVSSALKSSNALKVKGFAVVQAFNLLMELFISTANEVLTISEQEINDFVEKFLASIPEIFKLKVKTS